MDEKKEIAPVWAFFGVAIPVGLICIVIILVIYFIYLGIGKSIEEQNELWFTGAAFTFVISGLIGGIATYFASGNQNGNDKNQQKRTYYKK